MGSIFVSITALLIILNASAPGVMGVTNYNTAAPQGYGNGGETMRGEAYAVSFATWNNLATYTLATLDKKLKIKISDPEDGQVILTSPITVTGTVSDKIDVEFVDVMVGFGPWVRASGNTLWTVSSIPLTEGSNTITARATDTSENSIETSVNVIYTPQDTTNPAISIISPIEGQEFTTSSITVSGDASDDVALSKVEVKVGSGSWLASGTASWTVSSIPLTAGSNTITARATDTSGNSIETSVNVIYTPQDTTNPAISVISPIEGQEFTTSSITVSGDASDDVALSKVEVKVGSGSWLASGTASWTVSSIPLTAGSNTITARATDTSGNSGETSVTVTYIPPDTQDPVISITSLTNDQKFSTSSITVSGTASDTIDVAFVEVSVGSGPWVPASGTTSWTVSSVDLLAGSNTITARATDTSGNSGETSVTVTYIPLDTQDPVISITSPINDQIFSTSSITVSGTASDNIDVAFVEVSVGSGPWVPASGTTSWTVSSVDLLAGSNTITAKATDTSGNSDETSVTVTYIPPDTQDPVISITPPPNDQVFSTSSITVSGTASDNVGLSKVEVKVGSGQWLPVTGTTSWTVSSIPLTAGSNMITARANDTSGNSGETSVTVTYIPQDTQDPVISITSPTNDQIFSTSSITVSGTASDNVGLSKVEVKVGSGQWLPVTGTTSWTISSIPLTAGSNKITARANDTSGNSGETSVNITYTPQETANPAISIISPIEGQVFSTSSITVSGTVLNNASLRWVEVKVGTGPWENASGTSPWNITVQLSKGSNTIYARANYTNSNSTSITVTYTPSDNPNSGGGGSSGGGGGGGGASGENFSNIDVNEKYDLPIYKDKMTSYLFKSPKNPIMSVNIIGNTNTEVITAMVEALKGTSTLVTSAAPGIVYRNANVWVGTSGFASPKNIKEAGIKFRVNNNWMSVNGVTSSDIVLVKWNGNSWKPLETKVLSKEGENTLFEGKTNTFSSFAITSKVDGVKPAAIVSDYMVTMPNENKPKHEEAANITRFAVSGISTWSIILILFIINIIVIALYFMWVKK